MTAETSAHSRGTCQPQSQQTVCSRPCSADRLLVLQAEETTVMRCSETDDSGAEIVVIETVSETDPSLSEPDSESEPGTDLAAHDE